MNIILDRYIIKKFLMLLVYTTLAFIAIFIVVDLIENLDKFLSKKAGIYHIFLYYLYYIPYIISLTLPMNMLLSSLFSLGTMAQHNELIACMSSGISLYRIVAPLLVVAFIISVGAGFMGETLVPMANQLRLDTFRYDISQKKRNMSTITQEVSLQDRDNWQMCIDYYDGEAQRADGISLLRIENQEIWERLDAGYMLWDQRNKAWKLINVAYRDFRSSEELIEHKDSLLFENTRIMPGDLVELQIKPEEMNYQELSRFVNKMLHLGTDARKWVVDLYMKISYPFANFIIVLFGAPLASRKRRSGPALGFALALLICFVYFSFLRSGQILGHNGTLEPWLGAWIGNIVFGIGGISLMIWMRK